MVFADNCQYSHGLPICIGSIGVTEDGVTSLRSKLVPRKMVMSFILDKI